MELPKEIEWNIIKFMSHPIAEMIEEEFEWLIRIGDADTWDDFVKKTLGEYKCKTRKRKPHPTADIMKPLIQQFRHGKAYKYYFERGMDYSRKHFHLVVLDTIRDDKEWDPF